jgi:hypothetical protein
MCFKCLAEEGFQIEAGYEFCLLVLRANPAPNPAFSTTEQDRSKASAACLVKQ